MTHKLLISCMFVSFLLASGAEAAKYGAFVYANNGIGISGGWGTRTGALNAAKASARNAAAGPLLPSSSRTWSRRGYSAAGRGEQFGIPISYISFAYAYGWGSSSSAYNAVRNKLMAFPTRRRIIKSYN